MINNPTSPQTPFRIGLDLDHTILEYLPLARRLAIEKDWLQESVGEEKQSIKQGLIRVAGSPEEGEIRWQKIQALIFGERIHEARLFKGFEEFIRQARKQGCEVFIVSHKTTTSNIDPTVNLREYALDTLARRKFFMSMADGGLGFRRGEIFFESTRTEKVQKIKSLQPHVFIDDLPSVPEHPNFPESTWPILFGRENHPNIPQCSDYHQITALNLPGLWSANEKLTKWSTIKRGGNNLILCLEFQSGARRVLKTYFENALDDRPRLDCEWKFLKMLQRHQPGSSPAPLKRLQSGLLMEYIEGQPPTRADFLPFLIKLDETGHKLGREGISSAAHARLHLNDFRKHADRRLADLESACSKAGDNHEAAEFLKNQFKPAYHKALCRFESFCQKKNLDPETPLPLELHFPSPSDFGLHNCLRDHLGNLIILDFEYAGWDDPVKLLCDYLRHVGNNQPINQRMKTIKGFINHRKQDAGLEARLLAVCDLVGLEWILIVLNVLTRGERMRKEFAGSQQLGRELINTRLQTARRLLAETRSIDDLYKA